MDECGTVAVAPKPGLTVLASPLPYGGYDQPVVRVHVGPVPRIHDIDVVLRRPRAWGEIDLSVRGESGRGLGRVELSLENEVGCHVPGFWKRRVDLDAEGRAVVGGVLPGRYRAWVGKATAKVEVVAGLRTPLELVAPGR